MAHGLGVKALQDVNDATGCCVLIRNCGPECPYLTVTDYAVLHGATVDHLHKKAIDNKRDEQLWYVFHIDIGSLVMCRASGLYLSPAKARSGETEDLGVQLWGLNSGLESKHIWRIVNEEEGAQFPGSMNTFQSHASGKYMAIAKQHSKGNKERVQFVENKPRRGVRGSPAQWELLVDSAYESVIVAAKNLFGKGIGDIPRLNGYVQSENSKTEYVEIKRVVVPCTFIHEVRFGCIKQHLENPYYILRRYSCWHRLFGFDHPGFTVVKTEHFVDVGMCSENSEKINEVLGITPVVNSAGICLQMKKQIFSLFKKVIKKNLEVEVAGESEKLTSNLTEITEFHFEKGSRKMAAVWYMEDRFVLEDQTGGTVLEWTMRRPSSQLPENPIIDCFPRNNS